MLTSLQQYLWPAALRPRANDERIVGQVSDMAASLCDETDAGLRDRVVSLREQVQQGQSTADVRIVVPAFACIQEAFRRTLGVRLYDVQLMAGLALVRGSVAQMQTGEGKTFVVALPAFAFSLASRGVHVATTNGYLAERDRRQLAPVYALLGATVGLLVERASPDNKRAAYGCDITYGPGAEFGFDYLRDQVARLFQPRPTLGQRHREALRGESTSEPVALQRGHHFAIIDEIDSVLLDEACTPLVLAAAPGTRPVNAVYEAAERAAHCLEAGVDFVLDQPARQVRLTQRGLDAIHMDGGLWKGLSLERPWSLYVRNALQARHMFQRDVHYVVERGKVTIVDEFTGRIQPERTWQDGLHQAVEAKEGVQITTENARTARITRQRYYKLFPTICGLSGTAVGSEREFAGFYGLNVVDIPLRTPSRRVELPTRYFAEMEPKRVAIVEEIAAVHATGRPILVGSRTIENSEELAMRLVKAGLSFRLLNGKQDEEEATIVARAGELGAVTIATNMAGRGTDIRLGPGVAERGGLHMIGVERHESSRIDRQLAGRVARQGDPGTFRFYVSADDALLARFGPELQQRMKSLAGPGGEIPGDLSTAVAALQRSVEAYHYAERRRLLAHDRWLDDILSTLVKPD